MKAAKGVKVMTHDTGAQTSDQRAHGPSIRACPVYYCEGNCCCSLHEVTPGSGRVAQKILLTAGARPGSRLMSLARFTVVQSVEECLR